MTQNDVILLKGAIDNIDFAYDTVNNKFALFNIDPHVLVFIWHMLNQSRDSNAVIEYLKEFETTSLTEESYPSSILQKLVEFKVDFIQYHSIKTSMWEKLDSIFEDMKDVIK